MTQAPRPMDIDLTRDPVAQALEMSLADFIAPLLEESERLSQIWVTVEIGYKDGTVRRVKLEASLVERMRA